MVCNDSNEFDCNIFPGIGSSELIPVGRPMDDVLVGFKSQPQKFPDEFGVVDEDAEFLLELRIISPKRNSADRFWFIER